MDLRPGSWTTTSSAQLARLHYDGSRLATGNIANALLFNADNRSLIENTVGGFGNDQLLGNLSENALHGGGDGRLYGLEGNDFLEVSSVSDAIQVTGLGGKKQDGIDRITNVEFIAFVDGTFAADSFNFRLVGDEDDDTLVGSSATLANPMSEHHANTAWLGHHQISSERI